MEKYSVIDWLHSELCRLRNGGLAGAEAKNEILSFRGLEFHSRAIVGSAKVGLVVDLSLKWRSLTRYLLYLDNCLRLVNAIQALLNDWLKDGSRRHLYSIRKSYSHVLSVFYGAEEPSDASIPSYAVVVSAVVLLSLVYQYLTGNADLGSSKAYSRSSLDFRDIYVAVVLFLGAYVWIKFREVARFRGVHRGVHKRVVKRGRITKVVYDARLTPPKWNGKTVPKLELGQFATPQEAHNKFLIAAFYYNRDAGLLDGWFQVPPMRKEERSLAGVELREWVIRQAKKVYEDFEKKAEAAPLLQEYLEDEVTPEQDEVNVESFIASLLNSDEHQQPALVNEVENLGMDMAMCDDQGWEGASHSFDGMHEGLAFSNGHSLGFEGGSAPPVSQLPPHRDSEMSGNGSDQWDFLQTLPSEASSAVRELPPLVSPAENSGMRIAMQPILDNQALDCASQPFGGTHEGFVSSNGPSLGLQEESAIPIPQLPPHTQSGMGINNSNQLNFHQIVHTHQVLITYLQQQLDESRIRISQLEYDQSLQRQLEVTNPGAPNFELEMEQSMPQENHPCRPHGSAFW